MPGCPGQDKDGVVTKYNSDDKEHLISYPDRGQEFLYLAVESYKLASELTGMSTSQLTHTTLP